MIQSKGVKNLSATSIGKIRRMIAAVLAEPELYDQNTFGEQICKDDGQQVCGTVCCAAGWAVWLDNKPLYARLMEKEIKNVGWLDLGWPARALEALDLTCDDGETDHLFGAASDWPYPFSVQYGNASNPKQRARVFAKRWESFIKKDGRE